MKKNIVWTKVLLFVFAATMFCQIDAFAHKLKIFAAPDGDKVKGYCYMSGGVRPENLKVEIKNAEGKPVEAVFTDKNGEFTFKPSVAADYTFYVDTGDGHIADCKITAAELKGGAAPAEAMSEAKEKADESAAAEDTDDGAPSAYTVSAEDMLSIDDIRKVVAEEVASQIAPLREQLERYQGKIQFSDIIAAIGYILGIAGITFYLLATRNRQQ